MSDMPDFDSMSPEEMMRWMETLAKRQGADEGLTTDANLEIEEISEDDERLAGQGDYIPYGWTQEQWEAQLAKEERQKAERAAQRQQQPPPAAPEPPSQPEPEPEPQPQQPVADASGGMPDFDSMTPEEAMRWMESLAKRQGADEGLTTDADLEIEEVSADDERLAGQGDYIPYGWTQEQWEAQLEKERRQKAERAARRQQQPEQQPDELFDEEEAEADFLESLSGDVLQAPSLEDLFSAASEDDNVLPELDEDFTSQPTELVEPEAPQPEQPAAQNTMEWLAGLTGQEEEEAGELDFDMDALGDLAGLAQEETADDPMSWLAGLATGEGEPADEQPPAEAEEGSLEWMETLARRQGAHTEELVTGGYGEAPETSEEPGEDPGYQPFSFEEGTGGTLTEAQEPGEQLDFASLGDPQDWLSELANAGESADSADDLFDIDFTEQENVIAGDEAEEASAEYDEVTSDVVEKMNRGDVSPEEIANFFDAQFARAAQRGDVPDYIDEEEDLVPPIEAEIPDWLQETMAENMPDDESEESATSTAEMMVAGLGLDDEADDEEETFPDWLAEGSEDDTGVIGDDIFDEGEIEAALPEATDDTWVQAFVAEGTGDLEQWYTNALQEVSGDLDAAASAPDEATAEVGEEGEAEELLAADLPPETRLPAGHPQALPAWMTGEEASSATEMPAVDVVDEEDLSWLEGDTSDLGDFDDEEMPTWLRQQVDEDAADEETPDWIAEAGLGDIPLEEIPEWLRETMDEEDAVAAEEPLAAEPEEEPALPAQPAVQETRPAVPERSPAPVPVAAADIDVVTVLQSARQKVGSGDVTGGMQDFEQVVRANQALDEVEREVKQLAEKDEKKNPAVHRVLGDVLMRQGKLQEALDTYRKALNML